jgi:predicted 3-demethylubiquinone-9 3-methyltransferase (glyoxalase superfamily)
MQKITTFLWFDHEAEEAASFYVSVFSGRPDAETAAGPSKVLGVSRYGEVGPGTPGSVMTVDFQLEGQRFTALNGGPEFPFTEAISLDVTCEGQKEVDYFWQALTEGGSPGQCGWLKDRYGLSWQIVPVELMRLLNDPDPERADRAMRAMLEMGKIEIDVLEAAAAGSTASG